MSTDIYDLLSRLVAFPTVSRDSNLSCVAFIRDYLAALGVEVHIVPNAAGDKASLFASIGPAVPGGVILSGHTDVVPVDGQNWQSDPFALREDSGRLYGRGAVDMKGFIAAVLAAVPAMVEADLKTPIHLAFSHDEEIGCLGAPALVAAMLDNIAPPAAAIIGEPTRMSVVNGHKGSLSFFTEVTGHTVHSSRIDIGVSAVMVAARLVTWLEDTMFENRQKADPSSPFLPNYTTLHCGMIEGGTAANLTAAFCRFVTEIRYLPEEDGRSYQNRYLDYIASRIAPAMSAISADARVDIKPRSAVAGLRPEADGAAEKLTLALSRSKQTSAVPYVCEAGIFQQAGISTVVCGPGDIAQAHQADEYIEKLEMEACQSFLTRLIGQLSA